jgi:hypothetical protein
MSPTPQLVWAFVFQFSLHFAYFVYKKEIKKVFWPKLAGSVKRVASPRGDRGPSALRESGGGQAVAGAIGGSPDPERTHDKSNG